MPGLTERYPWIVAFAFGLLHGFGFAGALTEIGLPQNSIPMALLFFNVGVEIGQLLFIAAVLAVVFATASRVTIRPPRWAELVPPYAIGSVAWTARLVPLVSLLGSASHRGMQRDLFTDDTRSGRW